MAGPNVELKITTADYRPNESIYNRAAGLVPNSPVSSTF